MKILSKLFKREYVSKICDFKNFFGFIATWKYRNSHQRCSMKKGILEILQNFFFNKVAKKKKKKLGKNISINTLYGNVRLFVAIYRRVVENWFLMRLLCILVTLI